MSGRMTLRDVSGISTIQEAFISASAQCNSSHAFMNHILNVPGGLQSLGSSRNENEIKDLDRALRVLDNVDSA